MAETNTDTLVSLPPSVTFDDPMVDMLDIDLFYNETAQAIFDVDLQIPRNKVTAFIGPSGCGKSTLLRCINRMNDLIDGVVITGTMLLNGRDIYAPGLDVIELRRNVGMVFQKSNPFPKSIYENVVYSLRVTGRNRKTELDEVVERSLKASALWDEVKDRLNESAFSLSGGQMQRLCIARAIAMKPSILLMDEPCSALDPIATARIEKLIDELTKEYTIVIVTHNMQQAARISDKTAFFLHGKLIEFDDTRKIFTNPQMSETENYLTGKFG